MEGESFLLQFFNSNTSSIFQVGSAQVNSAEIGPAEIGSTQVNSAEIGPAEIGLLEV